MAWHGDRHRSERDDVLAAYRSEPPAKPTPDPTERVYVRDIHGNLHGPYSRSYAERLRTAYTTKATFGPLAELIPA